MKKFKEFRTEQKYIAEVGPIAATIGAIVGGIALYKGGKSLWNKFTGWKESQKEKKANKKAFVIDIKRFNSETGELEDRKEVIRGKKLNNDEVEKFKKKMQKDADIENSSLEADFIDSGGPERVKAQAAKDAADAEDEPVDDTPEDEPEAEPDEPEAEPDEPEGNIPRDFVDKELDKIPDDMKDAVQGLERKKLKNTKDVEAHMARWGLERVVGWTKKAGSSGQSGDYEYIKNSRIISFGEFIAEDVMSDLKKITKSKNDSEISLDDGNDIPIDPLTAEILVKYIEGLGSSEKNKTIKQIQRTERAFMKVLGKAHGA